MTSPGPAKQPFHRLSQPHKVRITTLRTGVVIGCVVGLILFLMLGILWSFRGTQAAQEAPPIPPASTAITTLANKTLAEFPTEAAASIPPAPPKADIPDATPQAAVPEAQPPAAAPPPPARPGRPTPPGQPGKGAGSPAAVRQPKAGPAGTPPGSEKEKRRHWLSEASKAAIDLPPFPDAEGEKTEKESKAHGLFPKAVWARPAKPERVLYQDQLVHGILMADFNSDTPGPIFVLVTQQVEDRWGQGEVLVPQYAVLVGKAKGSMVYGKSSQDAPITSGIWPDGAVVELDGQIGTSRGAAGLVGKIDNHLDKVILGTVLTAALNIGARVPFGNTSSYNPTLPQEFSRDFAQGINQAGQQQIQRQLSVNPTLTQTHGFAVSVSFNKNINFMSEPIIVSK